MKRHTFGRHIVSEGQLTLLHMNRGGEFHWKHILEPAWDMGLVSGYRVDMLRL